MANENGLGSVVDKEEGAVESTPCNMGRIAFAWVNVRGGYGFSSKTFDIQKDGRRSGQTGENTSHPRLVACDAPNDFRRSL